MVFQGKRGEFNLSLSFSNEGVVFDGDEEEFYGYKLDDRCGYNGIFVEWKCENGVFELKNDPYGFFPLFYAIVETKIFISNSIDNIIPQLQNIELDNASIALFLRLGTYLNNNTPFAGIKVLPPSSTIRVDSNGISLYQKEIFTYEPTTKSFSDLVKIYGELFRGSMRKFESVKDCKIAVPLSGGRDSRHILFELLYHEIDNLKAVTVKYPPPNNDSDVHVAKLLCRTLNINHDVIGPYQFSLKEEHRKINLTNYSTLQHSWIIPLSQYFLDQGFDGSFDGIGGDVLSQSSFITEKRVKLYDDCDYDSLADDFLGDEGYLTKLLSNELMVRFNRNEAKALLIDELKRHSYKPNPISEFIFWNRTRRDIASNSFGILARNVNIYAPYIEISLYRFLSTIPADIFLSHRFHEDTINLMFQKYSFLPYDKKTGEKKAHSYWCMIKILANYMKYFVSNKNHGTFNFLFYFVRIMKSLVFKSYFPTLRVLLNRQFYLLELIKIERRR
jgi:asparagine synthase (glutamine-hydrolysing)